MALYDPQFDQIRPRLAKLPAGEYKNGKVSVIYDDGNFGLQATHAKQTKACSVPRSVMIAAIRNGHRLDSRSKAEEIVNEITKGDSLHFQLIDEVSPNDGNTYANCKAAKHK
jgi:hypothetical protein